MTRGRLVILLGLAVLVLAISQWVQWVTSPVTEPPDEPLSRVVNIPEGSTLRQVAGLLNAEGLVNSPLGFLGMGKIVLADRRIPAGEYLLHTGMRPTQILSEILNGRVVLHQITVPEGYTVAQIADQLREKRLSDPDEFLRLSRNPDFLHSLNLEADSLEGYLFPNTYRIARNAKPRHVIETMVAALWQVITPEFRGRAREVGMSLHEVLTLASVIEKETSVETERTLVSAVFHNRLRRNIRLQSDPTVIYALEAFDGNLRKRDLSVKSPYNTYRVVGLPPGPIGNPGVEAIRAALYPDNANYLYFVSRNDGTHHFSSTLAEHNRAVEKYQRRGARRVS